ncbi:LysR family transcriptional regulator [Humitalea sp. 24SJ18S-53]|uniref:LysR family transcriptional regulator n=1 Tax=Humitalea sp. 24SJ18S-53 TaxID=3422307 RepID=UPI003D67BE65
MLDNVTLDQMRTFLAAVDEGSFSAAGRKLGRAQSVVSQTLANLEGQIGVRLFDRAARRPVLTDEGRALVVEARAVTGRMDAFKARAASLAGGLEAEVSIVVDVMFPMFVLTHAIGDFQAHFPDTALRVYVESLGAVTQPVVDGRCAFAVMSALPDMPVSLVREQLQMFRLIHVAAAHHPLAAISGPVPTEELARHVQLVLTDRSSLTAGREFGVFSPRTWRLADLGAKHAFLLAGLGWGGMPADRVEADLAAGTLVELRLIDAPVGGFVMPWYAAHRADVPPGPAGRWLIERLKSTASQCPSPE